jgi:hypothetical protein
MPAKLSSLRVDLEREKDGDWVASLVYPGVEYHVSSMHTPAYQRDLELMTMRLARKYKGAPVPPEERAVESGKLYARHILHGWRGLDVEYTPEVALETLTDPAFRPLTGDIITCSMRLGEPDVEYLKAEEGNSAAPSAGH